MSYQSNPKRSRLLLAAVLCSGLAAAPAPLAAQSNTGQDDADIKTQQFEDWTLRCRPASETQPRACRMHQQALAEDSGKPVLQFMVGRFGPEKVLGAVIYVPIGVRLPPGLGVQVDERPLHTFSFEICDPKRCHAQLVLEGDLLKDLKAGMTGQVKFQDGAGQVLIVPVSLKGFSAALRALP